jgi:hypothetical protein
MKKILVLLILFPVLIFSQGNKFKKFDYLIGKWKGLGTGNANERSTIKSEFNFVMGDKFIEVINDSKFEPTTKNPEGKHHVDKGFISYDATRNLFVFRQFHIEGFVIQYILVDSLSSNSKLVFESEEIENFIPGGKARWSIKMITSNAIETTFDVSMLKKGYKSFGENKLIRIP